MWLEIIRERRKELGYTIKHIAEEAKLTERTTSRIFSGETDDPYASNLYRIAAVLDLSLDDLLADGNSVVGSKKLEVLQEETASLNTEVERLAAELSLVNAENAVLKDKVASLTSENDLLRLKLEHKEEIISLHNYYIKKNNLNG
jgi:transcriptional regulator with XRE-family HTH domain